MDIKTKEVYDKFAKEFEEKTKDFLNKYLLDETKLFMHNLKGKKILDLGCGPGRDAIYFKEKGYSVVCVDISPKMIKLCKNKELEAYEMDMENISFEEKSFDGVWAYTSLLHIPKLRISSVLSKINEILKDRGVFCVSIQQGNSEGYEKSSNFPNHERFFAHYSKEEFETLLVRYFEVLHFHKIEYNERHTYLDFLCIKK
jgi:ubiquinone/menaquinone biosynthesis C-methylase UbiE